MKNLPPLTPDPVIEAYKKDIDRTLVRQNLRRTVQERGRRLLDMQALFNESQRLRRDRGERS